MDYKDFQEAIARYFTLQVRYTITGCKTRVFVHFPPVPCRGGVTLPCWQYTAEYDGILRSIPWDMERREAVRIIRQD